MSLRLALIAALCITVAYGAHPWEPAARDANWLKHHEQLLNQTKNHASEIQVVFLGEFFSWLAVLKINLFSLPR